MLRAVDTKPKDRPEYVYEERRFLLRHRQRTAFDEMSFARRALRILDPKRMTVAIYEGRFDLRIERGRDWRTTDSTWAMIGIPPGVSRERLALAIAEVAGVAHVPYIVETLISAATMD
jgi:hypothetical protein